MVVAQLTARDGLTLLRRAPHRALVTPAAAGVRSKGMSLSPHPRRPGRRRAPLAAAAPAGASAAAPWSAPATLPGAAPTPAPLIVTGDGRALAFPAADRPPPRPPAPSPRSSRWTRRRARRPARRAACVASVLADAYARDHSSSPARRWTAAARSPTPATSRSATARGGGDLGPLKGIAGSTGEHAFALAANDDGVVAVVLGNTKERRLLVRRPNGRGFVEAFSTKVGSQGRGATVAVGAKGDVLMVWENEHHIFARHVGTSGGVGAVHRSATASRPTCRPRSRAAAG